MDNQISAEALKKFEFFSSCANKPTGASQPCDEVRWFDFICQTVEDGKVLDADTLAELLQDETYCGVYPWDEQYVHELVSEYEKASRILQYYRETSTVFE